MPGRLVPSGKLGEIGAVADEVVFGVGVILAVGRIKAVTQGNILAFSRKIDENLFFRLGRRRRDQVEIAQLSEDGIGYIGPLGVGEVEVFFGERNVFAFFHCRLEAFDDLAAVDDLCRCCLHLVVVVF